MKRLIAATIVMFALVFSSFQTVLAAVPSAPTTTGAIYISSTSFSANWAASTGATGYYLDVATDSAFTNMLAGFNNLNVNNVTSYPVTGVTPGTNYYYYRVRAYNGSGTSPSSTGRYVDFTVPTLISLTVGTSSSDPNPVLISNGISFNGGPYVRTTTPFLTATFSEPVLGVQYSVANEGITLKNSAGTIVALAASYTPANNITATIGTPSTATFQPNSALATASCTTSKYTVTFSGGQTSTTIHDAGSTTPANDNAMTSAGPFYFTVDTTSPTVSSVSPANNATGIAVTQAVTLVFTENCSMDYTAYNAANLQLTNSSGTVIPVSISYSTPAPYTTLTLTPYSNLDFNTTYTLTLTNIKDAAGNLLSGTGSFTSQFTTQELSASAYSVIPSFLSSPVTPNVLIILDNSNSMDETLNTGDAIGSFNCTDPNNLNTCSRSVLARQALINLIQSYAGKINIGLMSYYVPSATAKNWYVYNNFYFTSYDPRMYCGIIPPPASCYNYCVNENPQAGVAGVDYTPSTNEADCNSACQTGRTISSPVQTYTGIFNSAFQANIREPIINGTSDATSSSSTSGSAINDTKRKTYCANIYPKTVAYQYTDNSGNQGTLYHSVVGTFYDTNAGDGIGFLSAETPQGTINDSLVDNHSSSSYYYKYQNKVAPTSAPYVGICSNNATRNCWLSSDCVAPGVCKSVGYSGSPVQQGPFAGTDDDLANGFLNYGQQQMWYPPYNGAAAPTWSGLSGATYAYTNIGAFLHVPMAINNSSNNNQLNALLAKLGANAATVGSANATAINNGFKNDATSYMACTSTGVAANTCKYIVNSGATPTASVLQDAISYLNGSLAAVKTQAGSTPSSPINYSCQKTFIIYVTDGLPSMDNGTGAVTDATSLVTGVDASGTAVTVPGGTVLSKLNSLRCTNPPIPPALPAAGTCGVSNTIAGATTNPVYSDVQTYILGLAMTPTAQTLLDEMAVAGGTATAAGHAYYANDPTSLNNAMITIFQNILAQLSGGTAASILNNSAGSGANLLQAVFYPSKTFDLNSSNNPTQCGWIGEMQNLWYYVDPTLNNSSIREDTLNKDELNLKNNKIVDFYFNTGTNMTMVNIFTDALGNGVANSTPDSTVEPDYVKSLWKAGVLLWERDVSADPRTIYTGLFSTANATPSLLGLSLFNTNPNLDLLQIPASLTLVQRQAKAATLINWVSGTDQPNDSDGTVYRARTITMSYCSNDLSLRCSQPSDCVINGVAGTCTSLNREWRLGDIISSTPRLVSNVELNGYDLAAPSGYNDTSYAGFTSTTTYKNRGMSFVGANDGMLHAFKLGTLQELTGRYDKAQITGTNLGREEWAYVPQSVLPYLTYLTSASYQHIYLVDKTPTITDASIGFPTGCSTDYSACAKDPTTWRTVLIGGMGIGGAVKSDSDTCTAPANCVKTPVTDSRFPGIGLSSYFALDVTNPEAPKFLWEFSGDPTNSNYLGYTTTGPAIVRIAMKDSNGNPINTENGKWFAVFASGPTGPINTTLQSFLGQSDQNLKIFIVDLATGTLIKTIDTGLQNAFAGTLSTNVINIYRGNSSSQGYYSDDAVYIGYTQLDSTTGTWTKGGVLRLLTQESSDPANSITAKQWQLSTLISGIGPVTTAVAKLQDTANKNLWIYFGTGRYFFKGDDTTSTQEKLYGVKEPCYTTNNTFNLSCTTPVTSATTTNCSTLLGNATGLCDQSGTTSTAPSLTLDNTMAGWFITLDAASGTAYSERVITDPVALTNGNVFFTTFEPNSAVCAFGGNTLIWALNYNSGGVPNSATMQGTALMQTSTGAFAELSLHSAFSNPGNSRLNGRRSSATIQGVPPTQQGLVLVKNPTPVKKFLHVREK